LYPGYGGLLGLLFMALLAALLVGLIVWVAVTLTARRRPRDLPPSPSKPSAKAILEERYAKGEIERDDYLQRKADLEG